MPLYTVIRQFPGATRTDLDAAAFRSLTCLRYHDGLAWIRSYWNAAAEQLSCIYEAQNAEQIRFHARRADIPCDEIYEVEEVLPSEFAFDTEAVLSASGNGLTDSQ
ncbi:MAG: DUF4242 domain-containing protein [Dehalococcoidia bacterium]